MYARRTNIWTELRSLDVPRFAIVETARVGRRPPTTTARGYLMVALISHTARPIRTVSVMIHALAALVTPSSPP